MSYNVIATPKFKQALKRFARKFPSIKKEYAELIESLEKKPFMGTPLGNNCYKIRLSIASKGRGKSGGARVITYKLMRKMFICSQCMINQKKTICLIKNWRYYLANCRLTHYLSAIHNSS